MYTQEIAWFDDKGQWFSTTYVRTDDKYSRAVYAAIQRTMAWFDCPVFYRLVG